MMASPPTDGPGTGGKYVPPQKRAMMNAGTYQPPASSPPPQPPHYPQQQPARTFPQNGARREARDLSGAFGSSPTRPTGGGGYTPSFQRAGSGAGGSGFHRWGDDEHSSGGRGFQSTTGTGWDIRDGRMGIREDENEIFKQDHVMNTGVNFDSYESIPVEMSGQGAQHIAPIASFQDAKGVHPIVARNVERVNYTKPTPVQKYAIPSIFAGRDVMACAQTGSGKTAAFLFPVITKMLANGPPPNGASGGPGRRPPACPVSLVLSPTRELAIQTYEEARKFAFASGIRTVVIYGGASTRNQTVELDKGCDICVATPGRLEDLLSRRRLMFRSVKYLILDEADRMLDMGFEPKIRQIVLQSDMPQSADGRNTIMFSATFPREIQQLAAYFLDNYVFITVGRVGSTNDFIEQELVYVQEEHKNKRLTQLLPDCTEGLTLIFVETKRKADMIENLLLDAEFRATSIHGDRDQSEREYALRHFKSGRCPILVATDVAARGLDIPNIKRVINFDLPANIDDYVHRIGRTGRAGNQGKATSFVNEKNSGILRDLRGLLEECGQEVPVWFTDMVRSCASARNHFNKFGGGGGGWPRRGGGGFGGRDIRHTDDRSFHRDTPGTRGGYGGGSSKGNFSSGPPHASRHEPEGDDGW